MGAGTAFGQADACIEQSIQTQWPVATRVIFRFAFVYFTLYVLVPLFFFAQTTLHLPALRAPLELLTNTSGAVDCRFGPPRMCSGPRRPMRAS
jgi:hypothetical protein